ncbi:MAG: Kelch repeat-containing protein [Thermomicrobiales bacterium]
MPNSSAARAPRFTRRSLIAGLGATAAISAVSRIESAAAQGDGADWRQLAANADAPSPRWDHTLAADDEGKQLILFGGRDGGGVPLADTWLFDRAEGGWTAIDTPGPEPRFGHVVSVDQTARKLYLFGGESGDIFYNDSWVFDAEARTWTRIDTGDSPLPTPRYGLSAVLDSEGHLIISHGFTFEGRFDDTWSLDLASGIWTDISPGAGEARPLKRCLHEAIWDGEAGRMLLFGGCSSGFGPCPQGDLWSFDPETRDWTEIAPAAAPSARSNPSLTYDRNRKQSILFGGLTDGGYGADLWLGKLDGDAFAWTELPGQETWPAPRASHDAVMTAGALYLFGGASDQGTFNDLWRLKLSDADS